MDRLLSMRVFQSVVDEGSFAAAARSMDLSSVAITRLVADLEEHLGVRLLQRTTRRLSLTEAGENYLGRVRNILQNIDEAHAVTSSYSQEATGTLRIHAPPVLASYILAPMLAEFRQQYPKIFIDFDIQTLKAPPIEEYDITLMGSDESFGAENVARKVVESESILVASPGYIRRKGAPQTPAELAQHDCLRLKMPGGNHLSHWRMWRENDPQGAIEIPVKPVIWANHTDTLLRAALDGAGITSVSVDLLAPYLTRGELVRVLPAWITGRLVLYAALPSRKFIPQRTRIFLDFLVEHTRRQTISALEACTAC